MTLPTILSSDEADSILSSHSISTSEDLIKTLKSNNSNSNSIDSNVKLRIANASFHSSSLQLTNKSTVLIDWLITEVNKAKRELDKSNTQKSKGNKSIPSDQVAFHFNPNTYHLLSILQSENSNIFKFPSLSILDSISRNPDLQVDFLQIFSTSLEPLLRNSSVRSSTTSNGFDSLQETIGSLIKILPSWLELDGEGEGEERDKERNLISGARILNAIILPWIGALENGGNQKKATKHFLHDSTNFKSLLLAFHSIDSIQLSSSSTTSASSSSNHQTSIASRAKETLLSSLENILQFSCFSTDQLLKLSSNWETFYQNQVPIASDKGKGKQKEEEIEDSSNVLEILSKMLDSTSDDPSKSNLRSSILKILPALLKVGLTRLSSESFNLFSRINPPINSTGIQPTFRSKQEISEIFRRVSFKSLILPSFQFLVSTREKDDFDSAKIRFRSIISLLEKISNEGLYIPSACLEEEYGTWLVSLKHVFSFCLWVYENDWGKSERGDLQVEVLESFDLVYKIEEKVIDENKLKRAFKMMNTNHLIPSPSTSISNPDTSINKAQEFLKTLISSHSNSRNLFQLIKVFLNSLMDSLHFPEGKSISSTQIINSPLLSFEIKKFLQKSARDYLTVNQVEEVLKMFHQDSRFILKDIEGSEGESLNEFGKKRSSSSDANEKSTPSKKRKSNSGIANGVPSEESSRHQSAISELIILFEFFSYILPSLPISNFNLKENRKEIVGFNREILDVVLRKGLEETGPRIGFRRLISGVLKVKTSIGQQQWFDEFENRQDQDVEMKKVEDERDQVEEGNDDWIIKSLDSKFSSILNLLLQKDDQDSESQIWNSELKIEFLRSFFNRLSIANETFDQEGIELLSGILHSDSSEVTIEKLIETSLSTDDEKEVRSFEWNGKIHGLNKGNEGLVIWKSSVRDTKILSLLNQYASDSLILFLSKFLLKTLAVKGSREDASRNQVLHQISTRLVKDSSFMELKRWRDILVQQLVLEDTKELDNQSSKLNSKIIEKILTSLLSLSQFKNEIMTSKQKVTIFSRLLKLDALLSEEEIVDADLLKNKVELRTYACSLLSDLSEADLKSFGFTCKSDLISSLVPRHISIIQESQVENDFDKLEKKFNSITLILFGIFCQRLVQSVKKNQSQDGDWVVLEKLIDALNSAREEGPRRKSKGKGKESTNSASRSLADEALVKLVEVLLEIDATEHNSTSSLPVDIITSLQASRLSKTSEELKGTLNKLNQQGLELVSNPAESNKSLEDQLNQFIRQLCEVRLSFKIKDLKLNSSENMDMDDSDRDSSQESSEILNLTTKFLETSCQIFLSFKAKLNQKSSLNGSALRLSRETLRLLNVCEGLIRGRVVEEKEKEVQVIDEKASEKSLGISSSLGLAACLSVLDSYDAIRYLSPTFTNVSTQLSISDYRSTLEALLSIIVASTSGSRSDPSAARDRNAVLKVYELLLRWGPEGTSKLSRTSFSNFLGYSSQLASKTTDPLPLLQVVDGVCAGKAMLLTAFDASRILSILSVVVGTSDISLTTSTSNSSLVSSTFSVMVSILSSLTRLRRDLISPLLPQLTSVLSQLISLFRTPRANLPKVQLIETIKAYPAWMIQSTGEISGLNEESAREFSRLLNGLITKTTLSLSLDSLSSSKKRKQDSLSSSRTGNSSSSSLSKSLSKHSSNILLSYILSLTSNSTTIPTNVRTELLPGLFALFETIGEFERDSLMVSGLYGNEGGKVILRRVWKEWERTRYKGQ